MINISVLYPNTKGSRFDMQYYVEKHIPMAVKLLGASPGFKGMSVERGLGGPAPESEALNVAAVHFLFTSSDEFMAAFGAHAAEITSDIPNYTDIAPVIQFNEVLVTR